MSDNRDIPRYLGDLDGGSSGQHSDSELLAAIAHEMNEAIIAHGLDGTIRVWNRGAERLFGYPHNDALQLPISGILTPAAWPHYEEHISRLLQEGVNRPVEITGVTRDGRHPVLLLTANLLAGADGKPVAVVAVFRDISAQKSTEQKLVALIESTPDPFIIVDAQGGIQRVNRQAEALFGYQRHELIGQSYKMLVPERFRSQHDIYTRNYQVKPAMRQMGSGLELVCLTRSGEEIQVEIGLSPVVSPDETTIMVRFRDVREQKREQAILQQARERADEANRIKSRFLAAASHDLRQPLQSISMNLGVLGGDIRETDRSRVIAQTRMALDTTNKLLNSLLNITKLEAGKVQPEIEAFLLDRVLDRVYNTESQQAREKHHRFTRHCSSVAVNSDPALLEQLLTNLVANAIRYTPPYGRIVLGCRRLGNRVRIDVMDNGPGIPADALDLIFDEYRQLPSTRREGSGLGLGLSIVKLLAELLQLKLEVRSIPGKGSCFGVVVPLADHVPAPVREHHIQPAHSSRAAGTILLIDDDEAVLDSTSLFLEMQGFHLLVARTPAEAHAALQQTTPDLIITDYGLAQEETGIDLLRKIRRDLGKNIPALIITGDMSLQRPADLHDNVEIVCKPVDPQLLLQLAQEQMWQKLD